MHNLSIIGVLILMISAITASAQSTPQGLESAYNHQKLSRDFIKAKQWEKARDEAKSATAAAPDSPMNRDAWLLLAAAEERAGNLSGANQAYLKYLSLSPSIQNRDVVSLRVADIEPKAEHYARYKWGSTSSGLTLGYSPTFQTYMQSQLGSDLKTAIDIGLRFGAFSLGYKRGRASVGQFRVPTTTSANSSYTLVPSGGAHIMESIYVQYNFEFGDETETKSVIWSMPLYFAGVVNAVRTPADALYNNLAYDMALGLRVDFYTKSAISFDISALYHLAVPFTDITKQGDSVGIKNLNGDIVTGSTTGSEIRAGLKILFGNEPPAEH